jgi:hypothetical protein
MGTLTSSVCENVARFPRWPASPWRCCWRCTSFGWGWTGAGRRTICRVATQRDSWRNESDAEKRVRRVMWILTSIFSGRSRKTFDAGPSTSTFTFISRNLFYLTVIAWFSTQSMFLPAWSVSMVLNSRGLLVGSVHIFTDVRCIEYEKYQAVKGN